ncbi:hypothetical protein ACFL27_14065 [candidate division CSSED10-310 bacterium]|uniref:Uncharacterized protein n=1 Tax=candidate division CSSED10-310 bacterium TaxID=2855610 RepID=A0ABV6YYN9_UNCC1
MSFGVAGWERIKGPPEHITTKLGEGGGDTTYSRPCVSLQPPRRFIVAVFCPGTLNIRTGKMKNKKSHATKWREFVVPQHPYRENG